MVLCEWISGMSSSGCLKLINKETNEEVGGEAMKQTAGRCISRLTDPCTQVRYVQVFHSTPQVSGPVADATPDETCCECFCIKTETSFSTATLCLFLQMCACLENIFKNDLFLVFVLLYFIINCRLSMEYIYIHTTGNRPGLDIYIYYCIHVRRK